jgi:hypothetical protein
MDQKKQIQLCMLIAIFACAGAFASDILMLAVPLSGLEYFSSYKLNMIRISSERLFIGNTLGVVFIPLELFGFWALYLILKKQQQLLAFILIFTLSFSMISGIAYHANFAFYGIGLQVHEIIRNETTKFMIDKFKIFHETLYQMMGLFYGIGSIAFSILILWKKTIFKKWHIIFAPIMILIVVRFILSLIPSPIGGYIAPGYGNITNIIFFIFLTIMFWKHHWE